MIPDGRNFCMHPSSTIGPNRCSHCVNGLGDRGIAGPGGHELLGMVNLSGELKNLRLG